MAAQAHALLKAGLLVQENQAHVKLLIAVHLIVPHWVIVLDLADKIQTSATILEKHMKVEETSGVQGETQQTLVVASHNQQLINIYKL